MKFKDLEVGDDFIIVNLQKVLEEHGSQAKNKKGMRALRLATPKVDRDEYIVFSKTTEQSQTCCTPGFNCMAFSEDDVLLNQQRKRPKKIKRQSEIVRTYSLILDKETEVKKIASLIISEPNQQEKVKIMNKPAGELKPGDTFFKKNKKYTVSPEETQILEERVQCEDDKGRQKTFGKKELVQVENPSNVPAAAPEKTVVEEIVLETPEEEVDETVEVEENKTETPWGYFRAVAEDIAEDDEKKEEE